MSKTLKVKTRRPTQFERGYAEASKAFGGCVSCYGKGYSTQAVGKGNVKIKVCVCGRGKQISDMTLAIQERRATVFIGH